jgi:hypothetical protein
VYPADRLEFVAVTKDLDCIVAVIEHRLRDKQGVLFPIECEKPEPQARLEVKSVVRFQFPALE